MVSADNVNYDVLSLIFAFLGTTDLVSTCLVSRSFRIGATPSLYRTIYFGVANMKRWPAVASPFTTIISHPSLGVHVRCCDIKAIPKVKGEPHPAFIASCAESLKLCPYMISFACSSEAAPFISLLPSKERLTNLKLHAGLSTEQTVALSRIQGLYTLSLYQASWNVCHALPAWIPKFATTLTSLTLSNSRFLNVAILDALLPQISTIRGLHIVGCPAITHDALLRSVSHTPRLESLSLTTWESSSTSPIDRISLPHLQHLSLDTRCTLSPHAVHGLYSSIFTELAACPLKSLTIKLSERLVASDEFVDQLLDNHGATLTRFNAVNVSFTDESIESICSRCEYLEQLAVTVPVRDMEIFSESLSYACNLRTLIDIGDSHTTHGPQMSLSASDVREIFQAAPTLVKVISGNRCWTCERIPPFSTENENLVHFHDQYFGPDEFEIRLKLKRLRNTGLTAYNFGDDAS